jgi:AcrR family transcriptional regulator
MVTYIILGVVMNKKEVTIERIIEVAIHQFATNGYTATSTNNIAKEAEVAKGLIFKYFPTKEGLYEACINQALERLLQAVHEIQYHASDPIERISEVIAWKTAYFIKHPNDMSLILEVLNKQPQLIQTTLSKDQQLIETMWIEPLFEEMDLSNLNPIYTKADLIRNTMYALEGLQHAIIANKSLVGNYDTLKEEVVTLIKIIIKGMEKQ